MKNTKLYIAALVSLFFNGCGGTGGCPPIFIPVYEVNVYDMVSGELICYDGISSKPDLESCDMSFEYSEDRNTADITVSLSGYMTETLYQVENQTWRAGCWDNPDYTTSVDIYLTPEEL